MRTRKTILEIATPYELNIPSVMVSEDCTEQPYCEPYKSLGDRIRDAHFEGTPLQVTSQIYGYDDNDQIDPIADVRVSRLDNEEANLSKAQWNSEQDLRVERAKSVREKIEAEAAKAAAEVLKSKESGA